MKLKSRTTATVNRIHDGVLIWRMIKTQTVPQFMKRQPKKIHSSSFIVGGKLFFIVKMNIPKKSCCRPEKQKQQQKKYWRWNMIDRVTLVLNRTVVVDSDWRFDNLCGSHLQSQSELYNVSCWYLTLVIDMIGQLSRDVIGHLSVKPWWPYWLWRLLNVIISSS